LQLEDNDTEGEKDYEQEENKEDTGKNNIGKDPFHYMIHERI
jgi:hypothetical protein